MRGYRRGVGAALALLATGTLAGEARAAVFAAPGGATTGTCAEAAPCDVTYAVETVAAGGTDKDVVLAPGTYVLPSTPGGELAVPERTVVRTATAGVRARIERTASPAITSGKFSALRDLDVRGPGPAVVQGGGLDRVDVRASTGTAIVDQPGVEAYVEDHSIVAVAGSPGSPAIAYDRGADASPGFFGPSIGSSTLVGGADAAAIVVNLPGEDSDFEANTSIFRGARTIDVAGGLSARIGASNVPVALPAGVTDKGGNQVGQAPQFADEAGGDLRVTGGPTVDASESGEAFDVLGVARPQGRRYDMGAYELVPATIVTRYVAPTGSGDACTEAAPCALATARAAAGVGDTTVLADGVYPDGARELTAHPLVTGETLRGSGPGAAAVLEATLRAGDDCAPVAVRGEDATLRDLQVRYAAAQPAACASVEAAPVQLSGTRAALERVRVTGPGVAVASTGSVTVTDAVLLGGTIGLDTFAAQLLNVTAVGGTGPGIRESNALRGTNVLAQSRTAGVGGVQGGNAILTTSVQTGVAEVDADGRQPAGATTIDAGSGAVDADRRDAFGGQRVRGSAVDIGGEESARVLRRWTNDAGDRLWATAGNWTGGQVPGPDDDVVVPAGPAGDVPLVTGAQAARSLRTANIVRIGDSAVLTVGATASPTDSASRIDASLITAGTGRFVLEGRAEVATDALVGRTTVAPSGVLTFAPGPVLFSGPLRVDGTVTGTGLRLTELDLRGTLTETGEARVTGPSVLASGSQLTAPSLRVLSATLTAESGAFAAARPVLVVLGDAASSLRLRGAQGLQGISSSGSLEVAPGADVTVAETFGPDRVEVAPGGTLTAANPDVAGSVRELSGGGRVVATAGLVVGQVLRPRGTLTVAGGLRTGAGTKLDVTSGGSAGSTDRLVVDGPWQLGAVDVDLDRGGYAPAPGDVLRIADATSFVGDPSFADVPGPFVGRAITEALRGLELRVPFTAPVNQAPPSLGGPRRVGTAITPTPGTWTSGGTVRLAYRWLRCTAPDACMPIEGATASTYTPGPDDAGRFLVVRETAGNGDADASADSAAFGPVLAALAAPQATGPGAVQTTRDVTIGVDGEPGASLRCAIDGGTEVACGTVPAATAGRSRVAAAVLLRDQPDGAHAVDIAQVGVDGARSPATRVRYVVDATAPAAPSAPADPRTDAGGLTFDLPAPEPGGRVLCGIDGAAPTPCGPGTVTVTGLAPGDHTLAVVLVDAAGNRSPATVKRFVVPSPSAPDGPSAAGDGGPPVVVLPATCASRRLLTVRVRKGTAVPRRSKGARIASVRVLDAGGRVLRRPGFTGQQARVDLRGLPRGRFTVVVQVRLRDGRLTALRRAYRTCAA